MPRKKNIAINSVLLHELAYVPEWTKHHLMQDDPLEGEPTVGEVFKIFENRRSAIDQAYEDLLRQLFVIKLDTGVYYTTPVLKLAELRAKMREEGKGRK